MFAVVEIAWKKGSAFCISVWPASADYNGFFMNEVELMQSTGIKNIQGEEIFEGDILAHDHGGGVESFIIERNPDDNQLHARYLYLSGYNTDYLGEAPLQGSIVVGNKWQNENLLNEEEDENM